MMKCIHLAGPPAVAEHRAPGRSSGVPLQAPRVKLYLQPTELGNELQSYFAVYFFISSKKIHFP